MYVLIAATANSSWTQVLYASSTANISLYQTQPVSIMMKFQGSTNYNPTKISSSSYVSFVNGSNTGSYGGFYGLNYTCI